MEIALTKSEHVIQYVRSLILKGELSKGDLLPSENELSAACGVSRVTTRKALATLADMGLIETRRGVGSFVIVDAFPGDTQDERNQTIADFRDNFTQAIQIKRLIDPEIAKYLALHAGKKEMKLIQKAFDDMEASQENNARYVVAGHEFHMSFVRAIGNPLLIEFFEKLEEMESPFNQLYLLASDAQIHIKEVDLEQHRAILEAIKNHDQDRAYYLTKIHLEFFDDYYQAGMAQE